MKGSPSSVRLAQGVLALLSLALLAPGAAPAQTAYKIQPIVKAGDLVGDLQIKAGADFEIGTINENGGIVFTTENAAGGEAIAQYADGKLTPIVIGGKDAPSGQWANKGGVASVPSMNQLGNVVFAAQVTVGGKTSFGTFLWDFKNQKATAVALTGMPAVNNLTFEEGGWWAPAMNNSGDIVFPARIKNAAGKAALGVFFLGRDGKLLPAALPDQDLPGGGKVREAWLPAINDAGVVAFLAGPSGSFPSGHSAYLWENGTIMPLAVIGTDVPGGSKVAGVNGIWLNNKNRNVLLSARVKSGGPDGLYLFADGKLTPVAVPGQEMPGGGKLKLLVNGRDAVGSANDAGQHVFHARLEDGSTAAYRMDVDGTLSLILKSGTTTDLGVITAVGTAGSNPPSIGAGINNKGQVALTVKIGDGPATLVLLTPTAQ